MNESQKYWITKRIEELNRDLKNLHLEKQATEKAIQEAQIEIKDLSEGLN